jgi:polyhydroxyalkanoate synthase
MHSEYLRRLYLNNDLAEGRFEVDGKPVSLRDIHVPLFAVSTIADHVAPWRSVSKIQMLTEADVTFVLSNGGHNAGIVNPPGHPNRHYQIATHKETKCYVDLDAWQASAVHHEGSWWLCWLDWLERLSVGHEIGAAAYGRGCHGLCAALRRAGHLCLGIVKEKTAPVEHYRESRADGGQGSDARRGVGAGLGGVDHRFNPCLSG